jgi:hypothetical protein
MTKPIRQLNVAKQQMQIKNAPIQNINLQGGVFTKILPACAVWLILPTFARLFSPKQVLSPKLPNGVDGKGQCSNT